MAIKKIDLLRLKQLSTVIKIKYSLFGSAVEPVFD
jgi:hypothetical protein